MVIGPNPRSTENHFNWPFSSFEPVFQDLLAFYKSSFLPEPLPFISSPCQERDHLQYLHRLKIRISTVNTLEHIPLHHHHETLIIRDRNPWRLPMVDTTVAQQTWRPLHVYFTMR